MTATLTRKPRIIPQADIQASLLNRGVVNVKLADLVQAHADAGVPTDADDLCNKIRAALGMVRNGVYGGGFVTAYNADKEILQIRLREGAIFDFSGGLPKVVAQMHKAGKKFSPSIANALVAAGYEDVQVNPQAKEYTS